MSQKLSQSEETHERLREQIVKDVNTIAHLNSRIGLFNKEIQETKARGQEAANIYCQMISSFGGFTDEPSSTLSTKEIFDWMKKELEGLPEFVGRATDFTALSSVNNVVYSLERLGFVHFHDFLKKSFSFDTPKNSEALSKEVGIGAKRFIRDLWDRHGRVNA